jgi:putative ABC transport system permease protein
MALPIAYNVRNLLVRWKSTLFAVLGISLVVVVLVSLMSMASGVRLALRATGSRQNAIVLEKGSVSEISSSFSKAASDWVSVNSKIARRPDTTPFVSPELVMIVALPMKTNGEFSNVTVRGVTAGAFDVRSGINILKGRRANSGLFEIVVGKQVQNRIRGLELGSRISIMKRDFEVVGVFAADGSSFESEIWGDLDAMASAFNRVGTVNSLTVRLADPTTLSRFDRELKANPQFQLEMQQAQQYYEDQAGPQAKFLQGLAAFVSVVMGIGAVFGAMNTMFAIVATRTREVGTLRALGFTQWSILLSFILEGLLIAVAGGVLGCVLSLLLINGPGTTTLGGITEIAFTFRPTLNDLAYGLIFSAIMGIAGSFLPAVRAARLPITAALREA